MQRSLLWLFAVGFVLALSDIGAGRAIDDPLYDGFALTRDFNALRGPRVHYFHFENSTEATFDYDASQLAIASAPDDPDGIWRTAPGGGFVTASFGGLVKLDCAEPNATLEFGLFYANLRHINGGGPADDDDLQNLAIVGEDEYDNYGLTPQDPILLELVPVDTRIAGNTRFRTYADLQLYKWGGLRLGARYTGHCRPTIDELWFFLLPTTESYVSSLDASSIE